MHTADELRSADFRIVVDGNPAQFVDLLPGFGQVDRLGVVVRRPCGGLGASILTLAAVTAFYDIQRARSAEFFIYDKAFTFGQLGYASAAGVILTLIIAVLGYFQIRWITGGQQQ